MVVKENLCCISQTEQPLSFGLIWSINDKLQFNLLLLKLLQGTQAWVVASTTVHTEHQNLVRVCLIMEG